MGACVHVHVCVCVCVGGGICMHACIRMCLLLQYSRSIVFLLSVGSMVCKKSTDSLDGPPLVAGCITLLRQFHSDNRETFLAYMGQYVRSMVESQAANGKYVKSVST